MSGSDSFLTIRVKATNLETTPAIERYVRGKLNSLEKFLSHYQSEAGELIFDIEIEKTTDHHKQGPGVFRAEMTFTAGPTQLRSQATSEDLYAAIDEAKDEMKRELRRTKGKHIEIARRGAAKIKKMLRGWYR